MPPNPYISVIIPAYNEEKNILNALKEIGSYLRSKRIHYEMIVVDDGSLDRTSGIVTTYKTRDARVKYLSSSGNKGKGYSVYKGFRASKGDLVFFSDADLSTPIREIEKLIYWIDHDYDIAIASRFLPDSLITVRQPSYRVAMGRVFSWIVQALILPDIKDTQCGFKVFKKEVVSCIVGKQTISGFSFDVEILSLAKNAGFKIKEVPVNWHDVPGSRVRLIMDSLLMLYDVLRIKRMHGPRLYK